MDNSKSMELKGFMKLPPELRLDIYGFVFQERKFPHPLMRVSKKTRNECIPVLLKPLHAQIVGKFDTDLKHWPFLVYPEQTEMTMGQPKGPSWTYQGYRNWTSCGASGMLDVLPSMKVSCYNLFLTIVVDISLRQGRLKTREIYAESRTSLTLPGKTLSACKSDVEQRLRQKVEIWRTLSDLLCPVDLVEMVARDLQEVSRETYYFSFLWNSPWRFERLPNNGAPPGSGPRW